MLSLFDTISALFFLNRSLSYFQSTCNLLLEFVIITTFILGSSVTLSPVRDVSPLHFESFEAELTQYPDRAEANIVVQFVLGVVTTPQF